MESAYERFCRIEEAAWMDEIMGQPMQAVSVMHIEPVVPVVPVVPAPAVQPPCGFIITRGARRGTACGRRGCNVPSHAPLPAAPPVVAHVKKGKAHVEGGIDPSLIASTVDVIDEVIVRELVCRAALANVDINTLKSDATTLPTESVQIACYSFLRRAGGSGGVPVLYKPDALCITTEVAGRMVSGLSDHDLPEGHVLRHQLPSTLAEMGVRKTTRGCFNLPKLLKELIRGGLTPDVRDYDISASFPRAVLHRHGDLRFVDAWVNQQESFVTSSGLSRSACKSLVVAAGGIGSAGVRAWQKMYDVDVVPVVLQGYLSDYVTAMTRDVDQNQPMVDALREAGHLAEVEIRNKVFYLKNSVFERSLLDEAVSVCRGLVDILSFEYDGLVMRLHPGVTWEQVDAVLPPCFVNKPYRTVAQLWVELGLRADLSIERLSQVNVQWERLCQDYGSLHRRLFDSEAPVLLAAGVVPYVLHGAGRSLVLTYKAGPGKCSGMSFYTYKAQINGGYWVRLNGEKVLELEMDIVRSLANVLDVPFDFVPAEWLKGAFTTSIIGRLGNVLFDPAILGMLDSDPSFDYLCFGCGTVVDLTTVQPVPARQDMYISKHTGYPYPAAQFDEVQAQMAAGGVDLRAVLVELRTWEGLPLNSTETRYPRLLLDKLERLAALPCFELLDVMHKSFTTRGVDGEDAGGWLVCIFRALKIPAAALGKRAKNFVVDFGEEGGNGKGLLWNIVKHTFGNLTAEIAMAMLTKDPPSASSATPDVFELRGLRFTCTPESEKSLTIRSMWLKNFGDSSTVYTGRGLYMDNVKFKVPAFYSISSNVKLELTSVDGGVMRRNIGVNWPVSFRDKPVSDEERVTHAEDTESDRFYTPLRLAGYLYGVLQVLDVFFNNGGPGLAYRPPQVQEATFKNISNQYAVYIREMMMGMTCCEGKVAMTKARFLVACHAYIANVEGLSTDEVKVAVVEKATAALVAFKIPFGSTQRVQRISDRAWLAVAE